MEAGSSIKSSGDINEHSICITILGLNSNIFSSSLIYNGW